MLFVLLRIKAQFEESLLQKSYPGYAAYAAMKGAMEVLTRYQAKELGSRQITVNTLAPGAIETDFGGGTVRDILIIFLALTSIVVWVLLGVLIWQIWRLTRMVQDDPRGRRDR